MLRIQAEDQGALAMLVRRFRSQVVAQALPVVGSEDLAEDVAQDVFVQVWIGRDRWRPSGSVASYLFRITRNLSLNRKRGEKSRRERASRFHREGPRTNPTPGDELERAELRRRLTAAIRSLPPRRREVFVRARLHRSSYQEVAQRMAISPQTVANHLTRATADLRQSLSR
jgi:RNA polymerase sigma-70 factor (family 1)